jgi:hypothetical protein
MFITVDNWFEYFFLLGHLDTPFIVNAALYIDFFKKKTISIMRFQQVNTQIWSDPLISDVSVATCLKLHARFGKKMRVSLFKSILARMCFVFICCVSLINTKSYGQHFYNNANKAGC